MTSTAMSVPQLQNTVVAGLYSQLTGVLAGFAFAGFILVVTLLVDHGATGHLHGKEKKVSSALAMLLVSFMGLVVNALTYALVSGEADETAAGLDHIAAGTGFGAAALPLLLATLALVNALAPDLFEDFKWVVAYAAPLAFGLLLITGSLSAARQSAFGIVAGLIAASSIVAGLLLLKYPKILWKYTKKSTAADFETLRFGTTLKVSAVALPVLGAVYVSLGLGYQTEYGTTVITIVVSLALTVATSIVFASTCLTARR